MTLRVTQREHVSATATREMALTTRMSECEDSNTAAVVFHADRRCLSARQGGGGKLAEGGAGVKIQSSSKVTCGPVHHMSRSGGKTYTAG